MKEISGYNVRTRQKTAMKNPRLFTMKNGKHALKGIAADDNKTTLNNPFKYIKWRLFNLAINQEIYLSTSAIS